MKKYFFFVEVLLFYGLLVAFNFTFFPHMLGFLDVDPHPFWFGILLFGFRYGIVAGFSSGVLSCILYVTAAWAIGEKYRFEELNFYILPSFFIFVGVFAGVVTARNREAVAELKEENQQKVRDVEAAKREMQTLQEINQGLEKRIVSRMSTMVTLYEGARRMEGNKVEELLSSVLQFTAKSIEAEEAALYLKEEEGWRLKHRYGWKSFHKRASFVKPGEGIVGLAGAHQKIVSIRDFLGSEGKLKEMPKMLGDAMLAGPLRIGERGPVIGVLGVQKMPFFNFNSASVNLFQFLLNWGSRAVQKAKFVEDLREKEIIDPELQVYSESYFRGRLQQELERSQTYYLPLSVGLIRVPMMHLLAKEQKHFFRVAISQLLKSSSREMDVVATRFDSEIPFALLLITASEKEAVRIKSKILENYEKLTIEGIPKKLPLQIGIASFTPKTKDTNTLLTKAREALEDDKDKKMAS